jgi:hypothetical protein
MENRGVAAMRATDRITRRFMSTDAGAIIEDHYYGDLRLKRATQPRTSIRYLLSWH